MLGNNSYVCRWDKTCESLYKGINKRKPVCATGARYRPLGKLNDLHSNHKSL